MRAWSVAEASNGNTGSSSRQNSVQATSFPPSDRRTCSRSRLRAIPSSHGRTIEPESNRACAKMNRRKTSCVMSSASEFCESEAEITEDDPPMASDDRGKGGCVPSPPLFDEDFFRKLHAVPRGRTINVC